MDLRRAAEGAVGLSRDVQWTPLSGGRTNLIWRFDTPGQSFVCKLYSTNEDNHLFPNDPDAEWRILSWLRGRDLAPEPRAFFDTSMGSCLVYDLIDGTPWRRGIAPVAGLLARLHRLDPPTGLRVVGSGSQALVEQAEALLARCASDRAEMLRSMRPGGSIETSSDLRLIHGDVVPANLLERPAGQILIDWQCPALADPCEDIATFLSPAMQSLYGGAPLGAADTQEFIRAYDNTAIGARYTRLAPYFHWRMAAYCLWKSEQGDADYAPAMRLELDALQAQ